MKSLALVPLTAKDYIVLYNAVGWQAPPESQVALALKNSSYTICIKDRNKPVGMGRVIGDGAISYLIKDVAVLPTYQNQGVGTIIVTRIIEHIKASVPLGFGVSVELISSEGKELFYEKFLFGKKPGDGMGHGMMALVIGEKE